MWDVRKCAKSLFLAVVRNPVSSIEQVVSKR